MKQDLKRTRFDYSLPFKLSVMAQVETEHMTYYTTVIVNLKIHS